MNIEQQITDACEKLRKELIEKFSPKVEYKKGDWVTITKGFYEVKEGETLQLTIDINNDLTINDIVMYGIEDLSKNIRHATPEEIAIATFPPDGTACLVRECTNWLWKLAYSNGKGGFYRNGCKNGTATIWNYYQILDPNNLPVNE